MAVCGTTLQRHWFTKWVDGERVTTDTCVRCGAPRPKAVWTLDNKTRCDGSNEDVAAEDVGIRKEGGKIPTAVCHVCGKRIAVRFHTHRKGWVYRTHYVLVEEEEAVEEADLKMMALAAAFEGDEHGD